MTVTRAPRIVDGLILYGDQAYSDAEWEERNRELTRRRNRRRYQREYRRRNRERINPKNREWMARHRLGRFPRWVGSLHSLACTGPTKATGCRCHKVRCYSKPPRPSLRVAE